VFSYVAKCLQKKGKVMGDNDNDNDNLEGHDALKHRSDRACRQAKLSILHP
jgi:hypothetical protein